MAAAFEFDPLVDEAVAAGGGPGAVVVRRGSGLGGFDRRGFRDRHGTFLLGKNVAGQSGGMATKNTKRHEVAQRRILYKRTVYVKDGVGGIFGPWFCDWKANQAAIKNQDNRSAIRDWRITGDLSDHANRPFLILTLRTPPPSRVAPSFVLTRTIHWVASFRPAFFRIDGLWHCTAN